MSETANHSAIAFAIVSTYVVTWLFSVNELGYTTGVITSSPVTLNFDELLMGRYVSVQSNKEDDHLEMAEIEIITVKELLDGEECFGERERDLASTHVHISFSS